MTDTPSDNKQLRIYGESGAYTRVSVEEAIARKLNQWKGWRCSAGIRGLYVDHDGKVWVANCASANANAVITRRSWRDFIRKIQPDVKAAWDQLAYEHLGPSPHEKWYDTHWPGGWPLPDTDPERSPQYLAMDAYRTKLWQQFEPKPESGNRWYKQFLDEGGWFGSDTKDQSWGQLGDIRGTWDIPHQWVTCPYDGCGCGADVILSKAKSDSERHLLAVTDRGHVGQRQTPHSYVQDLLEDPVAMEMNFPIPHQILWDITRRCNYDCGYCWPSIHNKTDAYHSWDVISGFIDRAVDRWAQGGEIRWNFGGGEPTMHPNFIDMIKYLKSKKQFVLVVSNGSRSSRFWQEAVPYLNTVLMSAHFGSMDQIPGNEDRFIENCRIVMEHHDRVNDDFWIEIKLMTPPGYLDRALAFRQRILDLGLLDKPGANGRMKGVLALVPIRDMRDASKLVDYGPNELQYFQNQ